MRACDNEERPKQNLREKGETERENFFEKKERNKEKRLFFSRDEKEKEEKRRDLSSSSLFVCFFIANARALGEEITRESICRRARRREAWAREMICGM